MECYKFSTKGILMMIEVMIVIFCFSGKREFLRWVKSLFGKSYLFKIDLHVIDLSKIDLFKINQFTNKLFDKMHIISILIRYI